MRHAQILSILSVILAVGCTAAEPSPSIDSPAPTRTLRSPSVPVEPSPDADPSTAREPAPSSSPTPASEPPSPAIVGDSPEHLKRIAVVEHDGIRMRIEVQRNPLVAGELNWVKTSSEPRHG